MFFRALPAFRKQFAELYLAAKKQLHYHELRRSKYPNFCDHTIKEPHISLTRRGKLNFLLQAFQKITSNSASCTRKSFFLSSSHAPPRRLPSCLPRPSAPPPSGPPSSLPSPRSEGREENGLYNIRDKSQKTPRSPTARSRVEALCRNGYCSLKDILWGFFFLFLQFFPL